MKINARNSSMMSNAGKIFDILATSLNILHSYFDVPNKIIFRSVSEAKFLDTSAKPYILSANVYSLFKILTNFNFFAEILQVIHS